MKAPNNFTLHKDWIAASYQRYGDDNMVQIGDLHFYKSGEVLKCIHFFDFDINSLSIGAERLLFRYINDKTAKNLMRYAKENGLNLAVVDHWAAPILNTDGHKYFTNRCLRIRRNYKKYLNNKTEYVFKESNAKNIQELWKDVLDIDINSWKGTQKSDMQSLEREDLQYIYYMLKNIDKISLKVVYHNSRPLGYSLMFKDGTQWYAVKWGASDKGREHNAGINVLFSHIESLMSKGLNLDFWGRRSQFYDMLKTDSVDRCHLEISKCK